MNILFFGQGDRAEKLLEDYLATGNQVSWMLSNEQSADAVVGSLLNKYHDSLHSLKLIKMNETHLLRNRTEFHVAHIAVKPIHSPVMSDPFNQPHFNSILELIELVTINNEYRLTVINSMLMGIGGNERALFGFSFDFDYIYMPFLPVDFKGYHWPLADQVAYPIFPTDAVDFVPVGIYPDGGNITEAAIPINLYSVAYAVRDLNYVERLAYHAFAAQLIHAQITNEIMLMELIAGNVNDCRAMANSVAGLTGIGEGINPEVDYNYQHLSNVAMNYCSKPAYVLASSAVSHAKLAHSTQARLILAEFNDSSNRHIAIYGGNYYTANGVKAHVEIAGLIASEIGVSNVLIVIAHGAQSLPEDWDVGAVYTVMIGDVEEVEVKGKLIDGSECFDLTI